MLSTNPEMTLEQQQQAQKESVAQQQALASMNFGELILEEGSEETVVEPVGKNKHTPAQSRRESLGTGTDSLGPGSAKRRGRPRGWTDARIHHILAYLERNMAAYKTISATEFYSGLCLNLGYDLNECQEIQDKCEKMVKKYENDTRRADVSWKWYARMNQVFGGPPLAPYGSLSRPLDDDAASSSLDSADEEDSAEGEPLRRRARGEDPFQDRLEHEKLLLKLKKLKSKTEMRHRDWEAAMEKQAAAFEELKGKVAAGIARLEKAIVHAGYELDQTEMIHEPQV